MSFFLGDRAQVLPLLLFRAAHEDREGAEGVHSIEHAHPAAGARQLLHADAEIEHAAAVSAVLLGIQTPRPASAMACLISQGYSCALSYLAASGRTDFSATSGRAPPHQILFAEDAGQGGALSKMHVEALANAAANATISMAARRHPGLAPFQARWRARRQTGPRARVRLLA